MNKPLWGCNLDTTERDKAMMELRTVEGWTFQQIGDRFSLSRERVRQILKGAKRPEPFRIKTSHNRPLEERLYEMVNKTNDCWEWTGSKTKKGYGRISTQIPDVGNYAHRLSWFIEHGPIPEGMCVAHSCGNPSCVRPSHLFLAHKLRIQSANIRGLEVWEDDYETWEGDAKQSY